MNQLTRLASLLLPLTFLLTGCYTTIQAPGAVGNVVDAATGAPVRGAHIARPFVSGGLGGRMGLPPEGLPAITVLTDKSGRFNLPPATHTQIAFMILRNPESMSGSFTISADGYSTNELQGIATASAHWRVNLGQVFLKKQ